LGEIATRLSSATESSITFLLDFLETKSEHVAAETFIVMKDILRKYSNEDFCRIFLPVIAKKWKPINEPNATVAFLWILGEFGDLIDSAPYIMESYIEDYKAQHHTVKLEILSSTMKLFFKRPPETQKMLGRLFETSIQDTSHVDVHDRALYYYRLLKTNLASAKKIMTFKKNLITNFAEDDTVEFREKLMSEFDTLSIPFNMPSDRFINKSVGILGETEEKKEEDGVEEEEEEEEEETEEEEEESRESSLLHQGIQKLDPFSDKIEMKAPVVVWKLKKQPQPLNSKEFQQIWKTATNNRNIKFGSKLYNDAEAKLVDKGILCIAATKNADPLKFYFYCQTETNVYFLIETKISSNGEANCVVKSPSSDDKEWSQFQDHYSQCFQ
jgi:AP-4 complex subunit beta-1